MRSLSMFLLFMSSLVAAQTTESRPPSGSPPPKVEKAREVIKDDHLLVPALDIQKNVRKPAEREEIREKLGETLKLPSMETRLVMDLAQRAADSSANPLLIQIPPSLEKADLAKKLRELEVIKLRFVDDRYPPTAIVDGKANSFGGLKDRTLRDLFTDQRTDDVIRLAGSVARVESTQSSEGFGTAFVAAKGVVATNCHVVEEIAKRDAAGTWALNHDLRPTIDFSDNRQHRGENEFAILEILFLPTTPGFDIALLRVDEISVDKKRSLPPALKLGQLRSEKQGMVLIGYPVLTRSTGDRATRPIYSPMVGDDRIAKVLSPGIITRESVVDNVWILEHLASTKEGNSGSPMIDLRSLEVVGLHSCCSYAGNPKGNPLLDRASDAHVPCGVPTHVNPLTNEGISSMGIFADSTLRKLLSLPAQVTIGSPE